MKKNRMMRLASVLLIAVLISTSAISGTYAKYVTTASGSDTARVAKWGVAIEVDGALFAQTYKNVANQNTPGGEDATVLTVVSSSKDKLVAPGTKNEEGITFAITGKPEVDVNIDIDIDNASLKDVYLKKDTYKNYTTANDSEDSFELANNYHPLLFTLKDGTGAVVNNLENVNILTIEDYLENTLSKNYDANTDLATIVNDGNTDGKYRLTWKWDFENGLDEADTLLGNLAANPDIAAYMGTSGYTKMPADQYNLSANIEFTITVTQID